MFLKDLIVQDLGELKYKLWTILQIWAVNSLETKQRFFV